jgi:hypothetical protein
MEQIKQEQVKNLIVGTISGHNELLGLNGLNLSFSRDQGLYQGVAKVTVNVAGKLDQIINNMIGLTLKTVTPESVRILESTIYNESVELTEIDSLLEHYKANVNSVGQRINEILEEEKRQKETGVKNFKEALEALKISYNSKDLVNITNAVRNVAQTAVWGTRVPIMPLLNAAKGMREMAYDIYDKGFVPAYEIAKSLEDTIEQSKVPYKPNWYSRTKLVEPVGQIYEGPLNSETIAKELMRRYC